MSAHRKHERLEVENVRPALMRDSDAAAYLARSASWIRAARAGDVRARLEGRAAIGPRWLTIGKSVFYKVEDLDKWIAANATERGVIAFSNRGNGSTVMP